MSTKVSPFLCCDFTIGPFSPNLSLPAFLCLFLPLGFHIYTTPFSLLLPFLMLLQKGDVVDETSGDLIGFWKEANIELIRFDFLVIRRVVLNRSKGFYKQRWSQKTSVQ